MSSALESSSHSSLQQLFEISTYIFSEGESANDLPGATPWSMAELIYEFWSPRSKLCDLRDECKATT